MPGIIPDAMRRGISVSHLNKVFFCADSGQSSVPSDRLRQVISVGCLLDLMFNKSDESSAQMHPHKMTTTFGISDITTS